MASQKQRQKQRAGRFRSKAKTPAEILQRAAHHIRKSAQREFNQKHFNQSHRDALAADLLDDLRSHGKPGLFVGMYYDENWNFRPPEGPLITERRESAQELP